MVGLVPAIHLPDKASFSGGKGVDHQVEPGDDDYTLALYTLVLCPNLPQHFVIKQAGACDDHPRMPS
jgi:hypothetical protein